MRVFSLELVVKSKNAKQYKSSPVVDLLQSSLIFVTINCEPLNPEPELQ